MADTTTDCDALQAQINTLQQEFETLWLEVSKGGPGGARYRDLRHQLDALRAQFSRDCGVSKETSSLPRSVQSDWRAG